MGIVLQVKNGFAFFGKKSFLLLNFIQNFIYMYFYFFCYSFMKIFIKSLMYLFWEENVIHLYCTRINSTYSHFVLYTNYHFNELLQYTTLSNFKFKYNRVTVQFSCLINKKKNMTLHCLTFLRTSIFINFITNLHEFYFSFFICLFVTGTVFFFFFYHFGLRQVQATRQC